MECKEVPYPLVPSRKDKERHLAKFLDIFKKLEITLPFRKALQQMPLYAKFLKDMLTKKNRYIHSDKIVVEGNCSAIIQRILPPKHKDLGVVTISCSIGEVAVVASLNNDWFNSNDLNNINHGKFYFLFLFHFFLFFIVIKFRRKIITIES